MPIREFGYIDGANARISELTGAEFGDVYQRLVADGSFVMDSEATARGMAALRQIAPDRAVELAVALQRAFYLDGLGLSTSDTYRKVAQDAGLDADAVAAELGVNAYPTLLAVTDDRVIPLARGHATAGQIDQLLAH